MSDTRAHARLRRLLASAIDPEHPRPTQVGTELVRQVHEALRQATADPAPTGPRTTLRVIR